MIIFDAQASHFNLPLPYRDRCGSALLYYQAKKKKLAVHWTYVTKAEKAQLSLFLVIYGRYLWISRLLRYVNFTMNLTDLMHGEKFIGRFFYIFHGSWLIKQLTLPLQQHYLNSFLIKLRRKNDDLAPNVETVFRHIFPNRNFQFLPHGNPRNLFSNTRIRLLATHLF